MSGEYFQGGALRGSGEGVRIHAHVERAADALARAEFDDGLGGGKYMVFVEGAVS